MKSILRISIAVFFLSLVYAVFSQQPPKPTPQGQTVTPKQPYDSTKAQLAYEKQKNAQLEYNQATIEYQQKIKELQSQWQAAQKEKDDWVQEIRKDNNWDETYIYNFDTDQWTHNPKPEIPPAKKK